MNKLIIVVALLIFTGSCKNAEPSTNTKQNTPDKADLVRYYYDKAFKLKLPLTWRNTANELPVEKSKIFYLKEEDTLLFGPEPDLTPIYGVLPDTSKFFIFLLSYPTDDINPVLMVFGKNGNRTSSELFGYSCGGADCGFYCMNGIFTWESKNSFYNTQEAYTVDCNPDLDTKDTATLVFRKVRTKGQINNQGKITFNNEETLEERKVSWSSDENPYLKE